VRRSSDEHAFELDLEILGAGDTVGVRREPRIGFELLDPERPTERAPGVAAAGPDDDEVAVGGAVRLVGREERAARPERFGFAAAEEERDDVHREPRERRLEEGGLHPAP
jgi:hypothetical protein